MKKYYILVVAILTIIAATSCDDNKFVDEVADGSCVTRLTAMTEANNEETRTNLAHYDGFYRMSWEDGDRIAVFADDSDAHIPQQFELVSGAGSSIGTFTGYADGGSMFHAVYPFDAAGSMEDGTINLTIAERQQCRTVGIPQSSMPMYAYGEAGALNFYNLCSILKLNLSGKALLKSIIFESNDGRYVSGKCTLSVAGPSDDAPQISYVGGAGSEHIILDCDGMALDGSVPETLYMVVPYGDYLQGFTLTIETYTGSFTKRIDYPVTLERSQLRAIKPFEINAEIPDNPDMRGDKQMWYKTASGDKCEVLEQAFDSEIRFHTFVDGWGIVTFHEAPTIINDVVFDCPDDVIELYLPRTVTHIGMYAFTGLGVTEINFPEALESLGIDAFSQCKSVKEIVIPEGVKSMDLECFGGCTALQYVTFPSTLETTAGYDFLHCNNLIRFYGETELISDDGHCFFSNSSYGIVHDASMLDRVAGCTLETYVLPERVTSIQNYALQGCGVLRSLTIHDGVHSCGTDPFPLTGNLKEIHVESIKPPQIAFDNVPQGVEAVYVPAESVEAYKNSDGWNCFERVIQAEK